jgi:hypothetical protein
MKKNGFEKLLIVSLFILVLVVFSFAERDSRKLERLYKPTQVLRQTTPVPTPDHVIVPASVHNR